MREGGTTGVRERWVASTNAASEQDAFTSGTDSSAAGVFGCSLWPLYGADINVSSSRGSIADGVVGSSAGHAAGADTNNTSGTDTNPWEVFGRIPGFQNKGEPNLSVMSDSLPPAADSRVCREGQPQPCSGVATLAVRTDAIDAGVLGRLKDEGDSTIDSDTAAAGMCGRSAGVLDKGDAITVASCSDAGAAGVLGRSVRLLDKAGASNVAFGNAAETTSVYGIAVPGLEEADSTVILAKGSATASVFGRSVVSLDDAGTKSGSSTETAPGVFGRWTYLADLTTFKPWLLLPFRGASFVDGAKPVIGDA